MIDCHKHLLDFYNSEVRLDKVNRERLETARDTCASNIAAGLSENGNPTPLKYVPQGSFAMESVVQHPHDAYDIDHGIVFTKASLEGPRKADIAPRVARQMVANAFKDDRFAKPPEVRTNCVRFYYSAGYHVDMPVYREDKDWFGVTFFEIASGETWKRSDPKAVTAWFDRTVTEKSPDSKDGGQMRRITCLLKAVEKTRSSYNWPSGFIVSVLVAERYVPDQRDDVSFIRTVRSIVNRLNSYTSVAHPVLSELLAGSDDAEVVWMRNKLSDFEARFSELENPECSPAHAMKIWDAIFGTEWFVERSREAADRVGFSIPVSAIAASTPFIRPADAGRYGSDRSK